MTFRKNTFFILFQVIVLLLLVNAELIYNSLGYLYNIREIMLLLLLIILIINLTFFKKDVFINFNIICLTLFILYMLFSWVYISPAKGYGVTKLIGSSVGLFLVLFPILMNYNMGSLKKFFNIYMISSLFLLIFIFLANGDFNYTFNSRFQLGEINTIWLGRFFGELIILIVLIKNKALPVIFKIFLLALLSFLLISTGSKGPLFSLIISLFIVNILTVNFKMSLSTFTKIYLKWILIFIGFFIFIRFVILNMLNSKYLIERFSLVNSESSYGEYSRLNLFAKAIDYFKDAPILGNGIGSFGYLNNGYDTREYPHNIVFETLSELGLIGLLLLMIPLLLTAYKSLKLLKVNNNVYLKLSVTLYLYSFINSLVSGDLTYSNIKLFFFFGLLNFMYMLFNVSYKKNIDP